MRHFKLLIDPAANRLVDTATCQAFSTVSSLATPAATAVAAAATPPSAPVISHSHRSSATVTGHQPQSPVISHSHRSAASVTRQQHFPPPSPGPALPAADVKTPSGLSAAALSAGREALPLQPPPPNIIVRVAVCTAPGGFSTGVEPVQGPSYSFYRGGASYLHNWAADFLQISAAGQRQVSNC